MLPVPPAGPNACPPGFTVAVHPGEGICSCTDSPLIVTLGTGTFYTGVIYFLVNSTTIAGVSPALSQATFTSRVGGPRDGRAVNWLGANFWSRTGGPLMWRNYDGPMIGGEEEPAGLWLRGRGGFASAVTRYVHRVR